MTPVPYINHSVGLKPDLQSYNIPMHKKGKQVGSSAVEPTNISGKAFYNTQAQKKESRSFPFFKRIFGFNYIPILSLIASITASLEVADTVNRLPSFS